MAARSSGRPAGSRGLPNCSAPRTWAGSRLASTGSGSTASPYPAHPSPTPTIEPDRPTPSHPITGGRFALDRVWKDEAMSSASPDRPAPARVSARIGGIAESATLAVDAKAKALKAAGRAVIGFGAGEPDFPTPKNIVDAAVAACSEARNHRYTPAAGLPELREAVAAKTARDSGYQVAANQVLITNGGKQAVYQTFAT